MSSWSALPRALGVPSLWNAPVSSEFLSFAPPHDSCNGSSDSTQFIRQCDQNFNDSQMYISAVDFPLLFMFSVRRQMSPVSARGVAFVFHDFPIRFISIISNDFTLSHYVRWLHNEILCLLHFCRPGFLTIHIPPWSSMASRVLRTCRSQRLDTGLKRVSWVRRYQGQCRALRPLRHQGYRLRSYKKDPPLCSGYMVAEEIMTLLLESPRTP